MKSAGNEIRSNIILFLDALPSQREYYLFDIWLLQIIGNYHHKQPNMEIPTGSSPEDLKARKQIIADFYAQWNAEHPDKKIWNRSLNAFIHVKYISLNETKGQASVSYESTKAVLKLTDILEKAVVFNIKPAKKNDKNQKAFDQMIFMYYNSIRMLVGHQTSKDEYVQYCITAKKVKNKVSLGR